MVYLRRPNEAKQGCKRSSGRITSNKFDNDSMKQQRNLILKRCTATQLLLVVGLLLLPCIVFVPRQENSVLETFGTSLRRSGGDDENDKITKTGTTSLALSFVLDCSAMLQPGDKDSSLYYTNAFPLANRFPMATHNPQQDCPISADIHRHGCYECHVLAPLLRAANSTSVAAILDIGGNIGLYGLSVAALGKDAFLIEPARTNQRKICATVCRNAGTSIGGDRQFGRVRVFQAAAVNAATYSQSTIVQLEGTQELNKGGITVSGANQDTTGTNAISSAASATTNKHDEEEGVSYARTIPVERLRDQLLLESF